MEESKPRLPFLARLLEFGRTLDREIFKLKDDFLTPPRQRPHNYDRGITELKNEAKALKEELAQLQTIGKEISTFASFIETTKEMADQQEDDLKKIESYLQKYGYKPMERQEPVKNHPEEQVVSDKNTNVETEESKLSTPPWEKGSPLLSDVTRDILMGKGLPVFRCQVNSEDTQFEISVGKHQLAGTQSKMQDLQVASPSVTEENLLKEQSRLCETNISETSLSITPEVVCQRSSKRQPCLRTRVATSTKPACLLTPEEPVLTTERDMEKLCIGHDTKNTPEEPVMESQSKVDRQQNEIETSKTPEEPVLVSGVSQRTAVGSHNTQVPKKTPEEPVLAHYRTLTQYSVNRESNTTPEEPVLSHPVSRVLENITPEEPVLSSAHMNPLVDPTRLVQNQIPPNKCDFRSPAGGISGTKEKRYGVDIPESPELSDVTLSLLSLTNSYNNKSSSFPRRDLYDVKIRKQQDSRRTCSEQDENLPVAHENEVSSIREDCYKEEPLLYAAQSNGDETAALGRCKWAGSHINTLGELPPSPQLSDITMNILQGSHISWNSRKGPGREFSN